MEEYNNWEIVCVKSMNNNSSNNCDDKRQG
jgi:hypothetical protein